MIPSLPQEVGWGAIIVSVLLGLFTMITQWRRGDIDQSAMVLDQWQKLVQAHESQIKRINDDFDSYRKNAIEERTALRTRVNDLEQAFNEYRRATDALLRVKDDQIAGLTRAIAQNSHSTAYRIAKGSPEDTETMRRLDEAEGKGEDR